MIIKTKEIRAEAIKVELEHKTCKRENALLLKRQASLSNEIALYRNGQRIPTKLKVLKCLFFIFCILFYLIYLIAKANESIK